MKFNHKISIKNINSDKEFKNGYVIKKKDLEFHIFLENKKIYINVIKDNKTYIFIIDDYEDNYDDICNLIKNEKAKFYEKKEGKLEVFYLEIKYEFDLVLKLPIEDSNVIDKLNIYKLNHFMNLINDEPKNQNTGNIYLSKYIKDLNSENNKVLKRIENVMKEIKFKKQQIEKDNPSMLKNIEVMKDNAELMIYPKKRFPLTKVDKGVQLQSYIIGKIDDFNLINNKLTQIYGNEVNYQLIYRASSDRDLAKIFKEKCKYIRGTLIVVKTDEKRIFGGFTKQIWDDSESNYDDENAFCFSLNEKKIYELKEYCSAIGCDKGSGPRFCYMFMINNKFFMNGGNVYNREVSHYNGQKKDFELTGGKEFFGVDELEVFKISPKN